MNLINLTGKTFGYWTVLFRDANVKGKPTWACRCVCGKYRSVLGSNLRSGDSTNCGCMKPKPSNTLPPYLALYRAFFSNVRGKHFVSLSFTQFLEFTKVTECHYCGAPVEWAKHGTKKNGAAYNLDRKDNSVGYTKNNCVVCCKECNFKKSDHFTYEQFVQIGKLIRSWR